jgi:L-ascorbate metabolism protein UlaG (beta-lactamase superfamily)
MKLTFIGHACFKLETDKTTILTDPFISENPMTDIDCNKIDAEFILLTHGHGDHVGDTVGIAKRNNSTVISTVEVAEQLLAPNELNICPGNIGGKIPTSFGSVKLTKAIHGSGVPGGLACGYVIDVEDKKIYFAGDTALTKDMELLNNMNIDYAILPIGDVFTMGIDDAVEATKMICPKYVIPMHYNTMPPIKQNPEEFKNKVAASTKSQAIILAPGESIEI